MSLNSEAEVTEILIDGVSIPLKSVTVYDGLDSTNTEYCLSANQGKVLNEKIDTTLTSANTYTDNKVAELVGEAPDTLNALDELSEALKDNKDVVTILEEAIANKVDKVEGKVLSTNDYTTEEKEKLASLQNYDDTQVKLLINGKVNQETLTNYYNKSQSVKYLHKIELSLINSAHNTTASIWLDYWSTTSSTYNSVQFVTHSSLSTALPCTGTVGGASGMTNAYCITMLNGAVIVNKNTEIDINNSCTITDNIVGYMFYN